MLTDIQSFPHQLYSATIKVSVQFGMDNSTRTREVEQKSKNLSPPKGVFGGVIVTDDFLQTLGIVGNTSLQGTITAIYDIGCFFGAIMAFVIGDMIGRKKTILLGTTIMSVGALLQITAYGVPQMIVGRIIAGIGNGCNTATVCLSLW
jgi:MFS family permease